MKALEFMVEASDYEKRLKDEAYNILIASKAAGMETIDVDQFIDHITSSGFSLSKDSVESLLIDIPFVSTEGDVIRISGDPEDDSDAETTAQKNKDTVSKLAKKATKRELG